VPRAAKQLELVLPTWGGRRPGAGRKRNTTELEHVARAPLDHRHPVHVTLRVVRAVGNLRSKKRFAIVRDAVKAANARPGFRIVELSVQSNHLHLLVEALDARVLGRGMQALNIRIAQRINKLVKRSGRVFSDRYHRRDLKTPREVRFGLAYVLLNYRKHAAQHGERCPRGWIDPCSSGPWFDGWSRRVARPHAEDAPTSAPATWLLRIGWRKHHALISPDEIPSHQN
jgi:REP element-mobilizing transposase RayT